MCGIVGIHGLVEANRHVREGLARLEYRGYDSAGIAWLDEHGVEVVKAVGRVSNLPAIDATGDTVAIGHTRWATHGGVTEENAHPHLDGTGHFAVVHNGTLEGHHRLRKDLTDDGATLRSDTDTEVLAHRYERARRHQPPLEALRATLDGLDGSWATVLLDGEAEALAFACMRTPLVLGRTKDGATILASDITAIVGHTRDVVFLEDGDHGVVDGSGVHLYDGNGDAKPLQTVHVEWDIREAEKAGHAHYMLKEIHDAPGALNQCLAGRIRHGPLHIDTGLDATMLDSIRRVRLVACGTSHHAALMGQHFLEAWAGIPTEVHVASDVRERPFLDEDGILYIGISQSGETLDTLEALRFATRRGYPLVAITNVQGSSLYRLADQAMLTRVGPEIGVAATKTLIGQVTCLALLALQWGQRNHHLPLERLRDVVAHLEHLPRVAEAVLESDEAWQAIGHDLARQRDLFFLGRGIHVATALEAALKFKEITYLHAEGFGAAELKHGPFALLAPETPCLFFLTKGDRRTVGNILEVQARGAPCYLVAQPSEVLQDLAGSVEAVQTVPDTHELLATIPFAIAGQLISYHAAAALGRDIDKPRNLAKSVTVE